MSCPMADVLDILRRRFSQAFAAVLGEEFRSFDPAIRPAGNAAFGDYQANFAMALAKRTSRKPRDLAQAVVDATLLSEICSKVEVAGPGFVNLHLREDFLSQQLTSIAGEGNLGVSRATVSLKVVVDYSSPNVAKEMHVGHLRSTIIGDAIARVLDFLGHAVTRQNHLGDWGTQFGMLIEHMLDLGGARSTQSIGDLNTLYQESKRKFDADPAFAERARLRVVALQAGEPATLALWTQLVAQSQQHFARVYARLGVLLSESDIRGESFYNPMLSDVVDQLRKQDALRTSDGAEVVYPEGFKDRDGNPLPLIVRKSDGGYLYATTDLAAARFRIHQLSARRIIYVTDARQSQHFAMVFQTLRQLGWAPAEVALEHVPFGTILGKDNKPFKTREGGTVRLSDLLDEAVQRARQIIAEKNPDMPEDQRERVATVVGIGAVKYADLSSDRIKDYVFDWDRMLAMEGNTAPYLQNAYVRIQSIRRKAAQEAGAGAAGETAAVAIRITEAAEKALGLKLLQFSGAVQGVADALEPHRLCTYLHELATSFHQFYELCPVLKAEPDARQSRLALCSLTARVLQQGLALLGIGVVEQM